jgi:hypothetical protein
MSIVDDIIALQQENDTLRATLHDVREALQMLMTIVDGLIEENVVEPEPVVEEATEEEEGEESVWEVIDAPEPEEARYELTHFGNEDKQGAATYRVDVSDVLGGRGF